MAEESRQAFLTPEGQTLFWWKVEQINNALIYLMLHQVFVAIMTSYPRKELAPPGPKRAEISDAPDVRVYNYFKDSIHDFGLINKDPNQIEYIVDKMKKSFEKKAGIRPNRAIFFSGGKRYFDYVANARNRYYLTGWRMNEVPDVVEHVIGDMIYCETFGIQTDNSDSAIQPFEQTQATGGHWVINNEGFENYVDKDFAYSSKYLNTQIHIQTTDQPKTIDYNRDVMPNLGVWHDYEGCIYTKKPTKLAPLGQALFKGLTSYKDAYIKSGQKSGKDITGQRSFSQAVKTLAANPEAIAQIKKAIHDRDPFDQGGGGEDERKARTLARGGHGDRYDSSSDDDDSDDSPRRRRKSSYKDTDSDDEDDRRPRTSRHHRMRDSSDEDDEEDDRHRRHRHGARTESKPGSKGKKKGARVGAYGDGDESNEEAVLQTMTSQYHPLNDDSYDDASISKYLQSPNGKNDYVTPIYLQHTQQFPSSQHVFRKDFSSLLSSQRGLVSPGDIAWERQRDLFIKSALNAATDKIDLMNGSRFPLTALELYTVKNGWSNKQQVAYYNNRSPRWIPNGDPSNPHPVEVYIDPERRVVGIVPQSSGAFTLSTANVILFKLEDETMRYITNAAKNGDKPLDIDFSGLKDGTESQKYSVRLAFLQHSVNVSAVFALIQQYIKNPETLRSIRLRLKDDQLNKPQQDLASSVARIINRTVAIRGNTRQLQEGLKLAANGQVSSLQAPLSMTIHRLQALVKYIYNNSSPDPKNLLGLIKDVINAADMPISIKGKSGKRRAGTAARFSLDDGKSYSSPLFDELTSYYRNISDESLSEAIKFVDSLPEKCKVKIEDAIAQHQVAHSAKKPDDPKAILEHNFSALDEYRTEFIELYLVWIKHNLKGSNDPTVVQEWKKVIEALYVSIEIIINYTPHALKDADPFQIGSMYLKDYIGVVDDAKSLMETLNAPVVPDVIRRDYNSYIKPRKEALQRLANTPVIVYDPIRRLNVTAARGEIEEVTLDEGATPEQYRQTLLRLLDRAVPVHADDVPALHRFYEKRWRDGLEKGTTTVILPDRQQEIKKEMMSILAAFTKASSNLGVKEGKKGQLLDLGRTFQPDDLEFMAQRVTENGLTSKDLSEYTYAFLGALGNVPQRQLGDVLGVEHLPPATRLYGVTGTRNQQGTPGLVAPMFERLGGGTGTRDLKTIALQWQRSTQAKLDNNPSRRAALNDKDSPPEYQSLKDVSNQQIQVQTQLNKIQDLMANANAADELRIKQREEQLNARDQELERQKQDWLLSANIDYEEKRAELIEVERVLNEQIGELQRQKDGADQNVSRRESSLKDKEAAVESQLKEIELLKAQLAEQQGNAQRQSDVLRQEVYQLRNQIQASEGEAAGLMAGLQLEINNLRNQLRSAGADGENEEVIAQLQQALNLRTQELEQARTQPIGSGHYQKNAYQQGRDRRSALGRGKRPFENVDPDERKGDIYHAPSYQGGGDDNSGDGGGGGDSGLDKEPEPAPSSGVDSVKWAEHLFTNWPLWDARLYQLLIDNDIPVFIGYVGSRVHQRWVMNNICVIRDGAIGKMYYMKPDIEMPRDGFQKTIYYNMSCAVKALVEDHRMYERQYNAYCSGYKGGAGGLIWNNLSKPQQHKYSIGILERDIHVYPIFMGEVSIGEAKDITGQPHNSIPAFCSELMKFDYDVSKEFRAHWGFQHDKLITPGSNAWRPRLNDKGYQPKSNTMTWTCWQRRYNPISKNYSFEIDEQGPWAGLAGPGSRDRKEGRVEVDFKTKELKL